MAEQNARSVVIVLAASVVLVGVCAALLWPSGDRADAAGREAKAPAMQQRLGVQGAETQSARRVEAGPEEAAPMVLPEIRPEAVVESPRDERGQVATPPAPPVPPSAAALAAEAAVLAVLPQVRAELDATLASSHQALRNACWKGGGNAAAANFPLEATFGADGGLLALSIADDRGAPAGVGACLRSQPLPLKVGAPGVSVTVATRLTLP